MADDEKKGAETIKSIDEVFAHNECSGLLLKFMQECKHIDTWDGVVNLYLFIKKNGKVDDMQRLEQAAEESHAPQTTCNWNCTPRLFG